MRYRLATKYAGPLTVHSAYEGLTDDGILQQARNIASLYEGWIAGNLSS
jgi:hypothetical protein